MNYKKQKITTKKKVAEPVVKDSDFADVIAYIKWFNVLDPELQSAATHLDKIKELRNNG